MSKASKASAVSKASKRAIIYARVSTDEQRSNYSISAQVAECVKYARQSGYALVGDRYVDEQTGRDVAKREGAVLAYVDDYSSREVSRPSLDAALDYLERVGSDVVLVFCLDRLARDQYIRLTLEREIEERGAIVEFVTGNYEDTPEGEVRKDLDTTLAKWENAKRVGRTSLGKRRKAERGLFVQGCAPYGYAVDKETPGGLRVIRAEAETVRRIFDMCLNGVSSRNIARRLNADGIPARKGVWGKSSILKVCRNETYTGIAHYNRTKRKSGKRREARNAAEWIKIPVTPIIERGTYDAAQRLLSEAARQTRRAPSRFYMLGGMVVCAECGKVYQAQTERAGKNRRVNDAQCYRHRLKEGHCLNRMVSARQLEGAVWETFKHLVLDPDALQEGYAGMLEGQSATVARATAHAATLDAALARNETKQENLTQAYIDPDVRMSKTDYLRQRAVIEGEIAEVRRQLAEVRGQLANVPTPEHLQSLEGFAGQIRSIIARDCEVTPEQKREWLKYLQLKAYIYASGTVELRGWLFPHGLLATPTFRCDRNAVAFRLSVAMPFSFAIAPYTNRTIFGGDLARTHRTRVGNPVVVGGNFRMTLGSP